MAMLLQRLLSFGRLPPSPRAHFVVEVSPSPIEMPPLPPFSSFDEPSPLLPAPADFVVEVRPSPIEPPPPFLSFNEPSPLLPPSPPTHVAVEVRAPSPLEVQSDVLPPQAKRVGKAVLTVALFLATVSFALIATQPAAPAEHGQFLFDAYTSFVYLTLCIGIGLSVHSILAPVGAASTWIQKRVMVIGLGFMAADFVLRTSIVLPMDSLTFVWSLFLLVGLLILLSLLLAWNKRHNRLAVQEHPDGTSPPPLTAGVEGTLAVPIPTPATCTSPLIPP